MKRFHVHVAVTDLASNIAFYSRLFGTAPVVQKSDYAKWLLREPSVNFAISSRGNAPGINHLGIQVETAEELDALRRQARDAAPGQGLEQEAASCCYAVSNKYWTVDPQGVAWEQFQTTGEAQDFGADRKTSKGACCIPLHSDLN